MSTVFHSGKRPTVISPGFMSQFDVPIICSPTDGIKMVERTEEDGTISSRHISHSRLSWRAVVKRVSLLDGRPSDSFDYAMRYSIVIDVCLIDA